MEVALFTIDPVPAFNSSSVKKVSSNEDENASTAVTLVDKEELVGTIEPETCAATASRAVDIDEDKLVTSEINAFLASDIDPDKEDVTFNTFANVSN